MNKKIIIVVSILVLGILAVILFSTFGRKPFAKLSASEIVSAELFIMPSEKTIDLTDEEDIAELADILKEIAIYREDNSVREYAGQLLQVTIILKNGETHTIGAYNPFLFLNGKCYRTKYEPCQKLNAFGNRILNEQ
ncbi:hypothetical protein SAMN05428976_1213 [Clostridium sp. USBA 49]|jgi:hypothetical protein|uniref:hypothetical protein n=1 Tax=Clostridium sp. USBA 49 TaxID=1881060 RepID=UPI00099A7030|nr:hypothetical protein [Clostridium sp. USBA 49]MDK2793365.1 hypothetical protein [Deferribacteres bacterium]SKA92586.1 hypothetical protein SAMN05428976_1213 [Clostridium sp. USBA 49]